MEAGRHNVMSRWVNGSLEDLLMVSISPRALNRKLTQLRAEQELVDWAGDDSAPATLCNDHVPQTRRDAGAFRDDLANDALEFGVRLLVVDSLMTMIPDEPENVGFFTQAASVVALSEALDRVRARVEDARVVGVLAPETPLGAYVKGLYVRASMIVRALEVFGFAALEGDFDGVALSRATQDTASFHFAELRDSIRRDLASLRIEHGQTAVVKTLRDAVEQLFVASARVDGSPVS
jgi:hypothetical protein